MWIVYASLDRGIPGIIEFFAEEEETSAKDLYAKIRVDFFGKEIPEHVDVGEPALAATPRCYVTLLHTVDTDEELCGMIKEEQRQVDSRPIEWQVFSSHSGVKDNTGVDNKLAEYQNFSKLRGNPRALYTSYRFDDAKPRKELSTLGFDKRLVEYAYTNKRMEGGYGKGSRPEIPEIATNEDDSSYVMIERDKLDSAGFMSVNGQYIDRPYTVISEITKKAWEEKKKNAEQLQ
jgi:hypothetical protein